MSKTILSALLPLLMLFGNSTGHLLVGIPQTARDGNTGTLEKMIVANGTVAMDLDLNRLNGTGNRAKEPQQNVLRFEVGHDSFFTVLVFNDELRGPMPGTMALIPQNYIALPQKLIDSYQQLIVEKTGWGEQFDLVIRDGKTGFIFFNIEGHQYDYSPSEHAFSIQTGRMLLSKEFAAAIGRPADAGSIVGQLSINATMRDVQVTQVVNNEVKSDVMPAFRDPESGSVPGPDVIVGDLNGLSQPDTNAVGTQVGISVGTDSCNFGTVDLDWFQTPNNNHPVIPQNLYRMSGGATNDERFEQIGQSSVKHAFTALTENICSLGCNGVGGTHLGSGCSDPYVVSLNSGGSGHTLGSRAWINPFTGDFPRADSATPPNSHTGHTHNAIAHRMVVEISDLSTALNPGATYYAEAQYITPHEYVWCAAHAGQCNMYNNVSYRRYNVTGTGSPFSFQTGGFTTQRMKPAIMAWTGATLVQFEPAPGADGIGFVGYKVTNPSPGVWHYEYAIYNQNLDRAIQSFTLPMGTGISVSNAGFHAPPQQPGWANDGTVGSAGFSSAPWAQTQDSNSLTWSSQSFAQNPNANAIRWGTLYNIRFDSNRPPTAVNATLGFLKTGNPINVLVQGPSAVPGNVSVSGRVFRSPGQGLGNVYVFITDSMNNSRITLTSSFGYYNFDDVVPGQTYTIQPSSKRYNYSPVTMQVNDNIAGVDFLPEPE